MRSKRNGLSLIKTLIGMAAFIVLAVWVILPMITDNTKAPPPAAKVSPSAHYVEQKPAVNPSKANVWPPISQETSPTKTDILLRRNYYVILDGSGSMKDVACSGKVSKFQSASTALKDFFTTIPADANVGLFIFDEHGISEKVGLGINNRKQLRESLDAATPGGNTPLSTAIRAGYQALTTQAGKQLGYGEYHLVVVTDGDASKGYDPTREVNRIIDMTPIVIHTIGYCIGKGHSLNQPGRTLYTTVDNAQSLGRELKAVLAESETFDITQFK